eukprot:Unigene134_Nuclearia_a/m.472 Unigene134_Nuclearia_a/g.472  ORF Unigene134_Nuclearia_a/g.472 Unigene134_Nuclearia_a/m.472 type:complete len:318 (-) Unigene134_Nuclearia_a:483-1436(-)
MPTSACAAASPDAGVRNSTKGIDTDLACIGSAVDSRLLASDCDRSDTPNDGSTLAEKSPDTRAIAPPCRRCIAGDCRLPRPSGDGGTGDPPVNGVSSASLLLRLLPTLAGAATAAGAVTIGAVRRCTSSSASDGSNSGSACSELGSGVPEGDLSLAAVSNVRLPRDSWPVCSTRSLRPMPSGLGSPPPPFSARRIGLIAAAPGGASLPPMVVWPSAAVGFDPLLPLLMLSCDDDACSTRVAATAAAIGPSARTESWRASDGTPERSSASLSSTNGCLSSTSTSGRSDGLMNRHSLRKSCAALDSHDGALGGSRALAM